MKYALFIFYVACHAGICTAQQTIQLYPGEIPNSMNIPDEEQCSHNFEVDSLVSKVSVPTLSVFLPTKDKATGTAVIICPGGGYGTLLIKREGADVARAFNEQGVAAFVLKYRLPDDRSMNDKSIGPLQDAQQAFRVVRKNAGKWNIDVGKIGIMGFSAGGHLAATTGTHFDTAMIDNAEEINLRPDFMILVNPVISFTDKIGHIGSRNNLLGNNPTDAQILFFSNEMYVTPSTPPTFLVHAEPDIVVPVENSITFFDALRKNNVPVEIHLYAKGEHGFLTNPPFYEWFGRCIYWMKTNGWIESTTDSTRNLLLLPNGADLHTGNWVYFRSRNGAGSGH